MGITLSLLPAALFIIATLVVRRVWHREVLNPRRLSLPPGPPPIPLIGNVRDVPAKLPWVAYDALAQKYGDIMHLSLFGQPIIVLSSMKASLDLLEKRSTKYSDRIQSTVMNMMGWDWGIPLMNYGESWRKRRRVFHQQFQLKVVDKYWDVQSQQSRIFLRKLLDCPDKLFLHTRHLFAATIMKITYGIDLQDSNDEYLHIAEEAMFGFSAGIQIGRYWVEFIPFLSYIPGWVPGAQFQKDINYWREYVIQLRDKPFYHVKQLLTNGAHLPCVASSLLENIVDDFDENEEVARDSAGAAFGGASDTTLSAANSFILAMILYPEIQRKAQAELDTVVGPDRMADFADRPFLPYIEAIVKETLRWQPVTPLITPHRLSESDEYRGYYIPEGAAVIANAWAILHDPDNYPEPHVFKPERFLRDGKLDPDVLDPALSCFGFGRRICPGRYLAINSLYSVIVSILHTFNASHALDDDGNPIPVIPEMTTGLISFPTPFKYSIKPRSPNAETLILSFKASE